VDSLDVRVRRRLRCRPVIGTDHEGGILGLRAVNQRLEQPHGGGLRWWVAPTALGVIAGREVLDDIGPSGPQEGKQHLERGQHVLPEMRSVIDDDVGPAVPVDHASQIGLAGLVGLLEADPVAQAYVLVVKVDAHYP
jgi:hypothetical protein